MRNTIKFLIKLHKVKQLFFEKIQKKIYSKIKTGQKKYFIFFISFNFGLSSQYYFHKNHITLF